MMVSRFDTITKLLSIRGTSFPQLSKVDQKCIKFYLEIVLISWEHLNNHHIPDMTTFKDMAVFHKIEHTAI